MIRKWELGSSFARRVELKRTAARIRQAIYPSATASLLPSTSGASSRCLSAWPQGHLAPGIIAGIAFGSGRSDPVLLSSLLSWHSRGSASRDALVDVDPKLVVVEVPVHKDPQDSGACGETLE